jgi:DNA-binding IclR family transcriptional regulator
LKLRFISIAHIQLLNPEEAAIDSDGATSSTALKALRVLDFIGQQDRSVGVGDVAQRLGLDRATAHRMLNTLSQAGYLARDPRSRDYRLSFKPLTLARNLLSDDERTTKILSTLKVISEATSETVHYSVLEGDSAVLVFRAKGTQRVTVDFQIGDRSPLPCTSIGKVLLAYRDTRFVEKILARGLAKVAPNTITDPEAFRRELVRVRAQGYAIDDLEFAPDMRCVAFPVFERGGEAPGGIAISGPASRFTRAKLEALRTVAAPFVTQLSRALGGLPHIGSS